MARACLVKKTTVSLQRCNQRVAAILVQTIELFKKARLRPKGKMSVTQRSLEEEILSIIPGSAYHWNSSKWIVTDSSREEIKAALT